MSFTIFILFSILVVLATVGFVWNTLQKQHPKTAKKTEAKAEHKKPSKTDVATDVYENVDEQVLRVFNDDFREELRNRGRLHFEKIISENAMFLQQDLRLTTSEVNDYMKNEITRVLKEEFANYEKSITGAKDQALASIQRTQTAIEEQRQVLEQQLQAQAAEDRTRLLDKFEKNMGQIINHYVIEAIGGEIDLTDQLDYILTHLEENKQAIVEDIRDGA